MDFELINIYPFNNNEAEAFIRYIFIKKWIDDYHKLIEKCE